MLGQIRVVAPTRQANIGQAVVTPHTKGVKVVIFEPVALGASSTLLVHVAASVPVALTYRTPDCGRDMAR